MEDCRNSLWEKIVNMGLENYLLSKGVTEESIKRSKDEMSLDERDLYYYYNDKNQVANDRLVPVKDIVGVSRVVDFSWFDILNYSILGLAKSDYEINIEQIRFLRQLLLLEENNLDEFQKMYNQTGNISFLAFKNGNETKYFQCTDGNHRVILAKITGLETIRANKIRYYEYNSKNYKLYNIYKEAETDFINFLEETEFTVTDTDGFSGSKRIVLDYFDFNETFSRIAFYPFNLYEFERNPQSVFEMIEQMKAIQEDISSINQKAELYFRVYGIIPRKLLKVRKYLVFDEVNTKSLAKIIAIKKRLEE